MKCRVWRKFLLWLCCIYGSSILLVMSSLCRCVLFLCAILATAILISFWKRVPVRCIVFLCLLFNEWSVSVLEGDLYFTWSHPLYFR